MKFLLLFLMMLFPVFSGTINNNNCKNNGNLMEISVKFSQKSDDFLTYWKEDFRKDDEGKIIPICDITYSQYTVMYGKYVELENADRLIVDATPDYEEGYTIKDSIKQLVSMHSNHTNTRDNKRVLTKSTSIIVIVVIAVFGMSTICVFFVLKNNNIIE